MKPLIFALCSVFMLGSLAAQKGAGSHRLGIRRCPYGRLQRPIHSQSRGRRLLSLREARFWLQAGRWLV